MRVGHGYDVHRFAENRTLILGGVTIPYALGMAAHSDGDVLIHALIDALLGAAGMGDIGAHFPDTRAEFENIDSRILLRDVISKMSDEGFSIGNADITLIAQAPKMNPHLPQMKKNLAADLQVGESRLNIKATTTEGLGFAGRKEGIACHAVVLLLESGD
ncbi:2-C-methyl-D-erythritol 2,4-cyclodiphosphate synthase [Candidatus Tenderia electrophaga]|jgi:2-C-methyl-D-erythritol 2,4-cyclodiphosphate synthase|uniref:2-C-methyl-D-erythritol 2,4-cyclodiphosphate synthase n=1 Tax=Candidatus Tenderia electrophaga TaxID=1748243 RepID=A0A0S2TD96_9GAMM|nr:2-C-methyl-D-erythritol 2,4-cyclodiphosphate synthase [Candidatus Tenderia electrophaga]